MNKFKIVVAGGRHFNDYQLLRDYLNQVLKRKALDHEIVIVSGKARGADSLGERYAKELGYAIEEYPADWDRFGKSAGYKRNAEMANNSDATIAFWDGKSRGTKHMIDLTEKVGNMIRVCHYD